ncbi:metal-dependent hydrolase [Stappia sp. WLB 29]|uniref:metal-dependent hydrolase n=1 Tax=Stappia sp. WLB 29 TaxID=2925220 RepID=UPI0020BED16C|nr:metal-dependent hydrolase [Stappia sp. WLB 29]
MDSLTQFVLGAAVSTACLGKTLGPRKAALVGGVLGTLPDLDVLLPFADPVDSFVLHRGATHSLFIQALAAPVFGEVLVRLFRSLRQQRLLVWLTVYLCFATHALIDAMTVYGTRLFWPIFPDPVGVGSIFIIDPLYTLPLLVVAIWALARREWSPRFGRANTAALVLSTAYMALTVGLQAHMEARASRLFAEAGIVPDRVFAIAAPFNTVVWKVIGMEDERYHNLYLSLLDADGPPTIYTHDRGGRFAECLAANPAFAKLDWFSRGYLRIEELGNRLVVSDLRMGLTPAYVFRFAIAERGGAGYMPIVPERDMSHRRSSEGDGDWLLARLWGRPFLRPAEAQAAEAVLAEKEAADPRQARAC